jgi:hypothetical protein
MDQIYRASGSTAPSVWRSPWSRHSGAARISVFAFVVPLHLQENRISRTESIFYPQLAANDYFG